MAIRLEDEYVQAEPASPSYPGGSFKNTSTPGGTDGTPLEKSWANDIWGFLDALMAAGGVGYSGAPDTVSASDRLTALRNLFVEEADAVSAATAGKIMRRDANGRAKVAAPSATDDIARLDTVTTHAALTAPHSATASALANRLALRDGSGDLVARLLRTEYTGGGANGAYVLLQNAIGAGGDNFARPTDMATFRSLLGFAGAMSAGWIQVPGGILQAGSGVMTANGHQVIFPTAFPTACVAVIPVMRSNLQVDRNLCVEDVTTTSFKLYSVNVSFFYIAIGY